MNGLYVYALVGDAGVTETLAERGLAGEALQLIDLDGLRAVAGALPAPPPLSEQNLAAQNATVLRLGERFPAVLPARFGQWAEGEDDLAKTLSPRRGELAAALELVAGCIQMTSRFFAGPEWEEGGASAEPSVSAAGEGARYLLSRRPQLPEGISAFRRELVSLRRAEQLTAGASAPLLATVHDLVMREDAADYRRVVERHGDGGGVWHLRMSGPWPPYAFTPGLPR